MLDYVIERNIRSDEGMSRNRILFTLFFSHIYFWSFVQDYKRLIVD